VPKAGGDGQTVTSVVPVVNPNGGLKLNGRPPGTAVVIQCIERCGQLRGDAVNEVDGVRIALAHNIDVANTGSVVSLFEGPTFYGG
jgi:acetyl-CoA C-acetyltransferase